MSSFCAVGQLWAGVTNSHRSTLTAQNDLLQSRRLGSVILAPWLKGALRHEWLKLHHPEKKNGRVCGAFGGGGIKAGQIYGETDEIGWSIVRAPVDLHDFHATLLHQFGFDHLRLTHRFQGRDFRLTDVSGRVIRDWIA